MTTTQTKPAKPRSATPAPIATSPSNRDVLDDIADAQQNRLDIVHRALFTEVVGEKIAESLAALSLLGDEKAIKRARADAAGGRLAVQRFHATADSAKLAADARVKLEREGPKLREQIIALQQQLVAMEAELVQHEHNAAAHVEALKRIRSLAPKFVKDQHAAASKSLQPLRVQHGTLATERDKLGVFLTIDITDPRYRHIAEGERNSDGSRPWLLTSARGQTVCDPEVWRLHLHSIRAAERHAELTEKVADLEARIADEETKLNAILDYWLHMDESPD